MAANGAIEEIDWSRRMYLAKHGKRKLLAVLASLGILAVPAVCDAAWVYNVTVKNVRTDATGIVTFTTAESSTNPAGCAAADFYGIDGADNAKAQLALLLTARLTGLKVNFYMPDPPASSGACQTSTGRPRVIGVMLAD